MSDFMIKYFPIFNESSSRFPEMEKISPPLLQMNEVTFGYNPDKSILKNINFDIGFDSRIAIVGANGAGKSTLCAQSLRLVTNFFNPRDSIKILTGELDPSSGHVTRNGRLRV